MSVLTAETAPAMETYARHKAWHDFLKAIAFSLQVWSLDADVRANCAPVRDWLAACREDLNHIIGGLE